MQTERERGGAIGGEREREREVPTIYRVHILVDFSKVR